MLIEISGQITGSVNVTPVQGFREIFYIGIGVGEGAGNLILDSVHFFIFTEIFSLFNFGSETGGSLGNC